MERIGGSNGSDTAAGRKSRPYPYTRRSLTLVLYGTGVDSMQPGLSALGCPTSTQRSTWPLSRSLQHNAAQTMNRHVQCHVRTQNARGDLPNQLPDRCLRGHVSVRSPCIRQGLLRSRTCLFTVRSSGCSYGTSLVTGSVRPIRLRSSAISCL